MVNLGILVGIDNVNNTKAYRILVASIDKVADKQYNWKFNRKIVNEMELKNLLRNNTKWLNIALVGNDIKGTSGDIKRFDDKPYVIISHIVNSDGKTLAYKIANYDGKVINVRVKELINYGLRRSKENKIPVQNAIFISNAEDRTPHYKAYPGQSFLEELILVNKNEHIDNRKVNTVKNEKELVRKEEIFTKEQLMQLSLGKKEGLQIKIYANPKLTPMQMKMLREGLKKGVNVRPYAFPDYKPEVMKFYSMEQSIGRDIKKYLNSKYSLQQLAELSIAVDEGLDVSKMADPELSVDKMAERRIRLENNVFYEEEVEADGVWV